MPEHTLHLETADPFLYLQRTQAHDAPMLYDFIADPPTRAHMFRFEPWARGFTQGVAQRQVANVCKLMREGDTVMQYRLMRRVAGKEDHMAGCCTLFDHLGGSALLGYYLAPADCGQGLATIGSRRLIEYAREAWDLQEVGLRIADENLASQGVARRLGAEPTGEVVRLQFNTQPLDVRVWKIELR